MHTGHLLWVRAGKHSFPKNPVRTLDQKDQREQEDQTKR